MLDVAFFNRQAGIEPWNPIMEVADFNSRRSPYRSSIRCQFMH